MMKKIFFLLLFLLIVASCASKKVPVKVYDTAETVYEKNMEILKSGNYYLAGENFEKIEDDFPFTKESSNGLMMSAYSYYKAKEYDESIRIIDYFTQSNPASPHLDYMQYLKSLSYYDRMNSIHKAVEIAEQANINFRMLIAKYPRSVYAKDAKNRLKKVETYLSGNEMSVANFYFKRKNYLGAINHYTNIIRNYPNSDYAPEALYRLIEINTQLNLKVEAIKFYQILNQKHQNNKWNKYAENIIKKYKI